MLMSRSPRTLTAADRFADRSLMVLGLINTLVVTAFMIIVMITANSARAQDLPVCTGVNLLEQMRTEDAAAYEAVLAEAAGTRFADALLYRVEKPGAAPSFLFGTMHMTDPRVTTLPASAQAAFDEATVVAIETTEILDPAKAQMALLSKPELTMFTGAERLTDFLDDDDSAALQKGLADRGLQLALVDRMKPWLISGMVAMPACEMARKKGGVDILDIALARMAEAEGKELVGLETIVEQFEAMASLPMEFHVQGLVETIALGDQVDDIIETMLALYAEGRVGLVWPVLKSLTPEASASTEGYAAFEEAMVHARNRTMADRAAPLLEKGNAFIAVGALHLPGEQGLAALFENAGYTVTPVK